MFSVNDMNDCELNTLSNVCVSKGILAELKNGRQNNETKDFRLDQGFPTFFTPAPRAGPRRCGAQCKIWARGPMQDRGAGPLEQ